MADKHIYKLATSRAGERSRIWLEGKRLLAHGFYHQAKVHRKWSDGKLLLRVVNDKKFEALPRNERTTVAGSEDRPIIDITGAQVTSTFTGTHVAVSFTKELISITNGEAL